MSATFHWIDYLKERLSDKFYLQNLGGILFYLSCTAVLLLYLLQPVLVKGFLAFWSSQYEKLPFGEVPSGRYVLIIFRFTGLRQECRYLGIYTALALGQCLAGVLIWTVWLVGRLRANRIIHKALVHSVLSSTLRYITCTSFQFSRTKRSF